MAGQNFQTSKKWLVANILLASLAILANVTYIFPQNYNKFVICENQLLT